MYTNDGGSAEWYFRVPKAVGSASNIGRVYVGAGFDGATIDIGTYGAWNDDGDTLDLTGAFYITLVSPSNLFYPSTTDLGYYLTKQLDATQVTVSFTKSYN